MITWQEKNKHDETVLSSWGMSNQWVRLPPADTPIKNQGLSDDFGLGVGKARTNDKLDPRSILGSGKSPGERIGYLLQYFWASLVAQLGEGNGNPLAIGGGGGRNLSE